MNKNLVTKKFIARGTTCNNCAEIIKDQALQIEGVKDVDFNYSTETGSVTFDANKTNIDTILYKIEEKGYTCTIGVEGTKNKWNTIFGWIFALIGIIVAGYFILHFIEGINLPEISANMGYGLLFVVGLLTGFHCVSMCGGFVVSYTAKHAQEGTKSHKSHLMYGAGKIVSYTVIGAMFGLLGSIIAFTPMMRGVAGLLAGLFLILFGLKMLNFIPILRKIQFKTPKFIAKFVGEKQKDSSPLVIGLLNGLMIACGPLQAIYIMAAGTGSMVEGAKLLFVFALGTLPVMLGFGYFASYLSNKMTNKILKASGVVVIILGLLMMNNGLTLTGTGYDFNSITGNAIATSSDNVAVMNGDYQEIKMEVDRSGWTPDRFVLRKDVPVKWIINGEEINGCNNAIQVPKLGLNFDIEEGEQVIEFTPTEEGTITWSCWMGMIPGVFIVSENVDQVELDEIEVPKGGSCGGGCGCGSR
ncbi:MAG: sulfite exporter TauE/SafE family protein [archaeon]